MTDYKAIFEAIETSLIENSKNSISLQYELNRFKSYENRTFTDEEFYEISQVVVFASGFKASTMHKYHGGVRKHFPDISTAANLTSEDVQRIASSGDVIGHIKKLNACIHNAKSVQKIVSGFGSTANYIHSFAPHTQMKNLMKLRDDLIKRFEYIAGITSFHLMTDLGLPVLKPDRVIMRIFERLGLLYDESQLFRAIELGQEFAKATGYTIRYIDIVFVTYGQVEGWGDKGICLEKNPRCQICLAQNYCEYYKAKE